MDFSTSDEQQAIRNAVRDLCGDFPDAYWRETDANRRYPTEFVQALTDAGWLAALIPEAYGGSGLGIADASAILEEINRSGGQSAAAHAQMYIMGALVRHGNEQQKRTYLPRIASGELRLQAFAVTEPDAGSETTRIKTFARKDGGRYIVNGQKVFISRTQHSDLMLLLARTTPYEELSDKTRGLSIFLVDLREAVAKGQVSITPLDMMINHHTTQLFITDLEVPAENLIGNEGEGFRHIIDGWNAERILIASQSVGDGLWFTERASKYASEREVFDRPIGANQGVQFPIAQAYARVRAAALVRDKAAWLFDKGKSCGEEANTAKLLASQAAWDAANACLDTHGGYGFARDFDVERKFRETRLYVTAPVSNNMVLNFLSQNVLGMPRSY
jgi:acyl-CoA dehydrogenase